LNRQINPQLIFYSNLSAGRGVIILIVGSWGSNLDSLLKKADCGVPSRLAKATLKGPGLDGLTEQSAKL